MRTLIIYFVLVTWAVAAKAQQVTELKEAKVNFAPLSTEMVNNGNEYVFNIKETYAGEFEKDPVAFMEEYLDMKNFVAELKDEKYASYHVKFRSSKGFLKADFDEDGNLLSTSEKFKNILLPAGLREQLYRDHKGWEMTKNVHVVRGKNGTIDQDYYKVVIRNGKDKKRIKMNALRVKDTGIAGNH